MGWWECSRRCEQQGAAESKGGEAAEARGEDLNLLFSAGGLHLFNTLPKNESDEEEGGHWPKGPEPGALGTEGCQ